MECTFPELTRWPSDRRAICNPPHGEALEVSQFVHALGQPIDPRRLSQPHFLDADGDMT